ncbi:MAG: LicD family protein [Bacteroidales bacterium]|nr:LicD family protein [Bacteroidales bacterium]
MAQYEIRPLQLRLLDILLVIDNMCKKYNLRYYLVDGSLLGAVRHKGFIPWDDDMDICMPREDYEALILHSKEWLPNPYEFVCFENDDKYPLHFGKIQDASTTLIERPHLYYLGGVYVDIFPIDGAPNCKLRQKLYQIKYNYLRKALYFLFRDPYRHGHGTSSWIPLLMRKMYTLNSLQNKIKRHMMKFDLKNSKLAAVNHNDGLKSMVNKENVLGNPTPIEFEGKMVWGLKNNDSYLTQLFGDYMTPPPPDKIHQHNFYYMNLDLPYKEFDESILNNK